MIKFRNSFKPLKKGDIVDILLPGRGARPAEIKACADYIKSLGLIPRYPRDLIGKDMFCSNNDEKRFEHLKKALYSDDSAAIWCIRGGYGTSRLMTYLEPCPPPENYKLLIGFSDITTLHIFLTQKWGWNSLHAIMLWQIIDDQVDKISIKKTEKIIFGKTKEILFNLKPLNSNIKTLQAEITAGNLSLIQNSIGTSWQINTAGKILLMEDVDEEAYRIDRALVQLKQAGIIGKSSAIIFGDFSGGKNQLDVKQIDATLKRFASEIDVPVFRVKNIGHKKANHPIFCGKNAVIEVANNINLRQKI